MKFIFGKLVQKFYKKWFDRGDFYVPERKLTIDQEKNLKIDSIELLKNDSLILLRDIWVSMNEVKQLDEVNSFKITTGAELEKYKRLGLESFFDLITKYSQIEFNEEEKFDKHEII